MLDQLLGDVEGLLEVTNWSRLSGKSESDRLRVFQQKRPLRQARVARSTRRRTACNAVLNTAELLERILSHLEFPVKHHPGAFVGSFSAKPWAMEKNHKRVAIFSCLRVSKYWNSLITTSPILKRLMWLTQPPHPMKLGNMPQKEFQRVAEGYKIQTSASLSIFAPKRLAPVTLNPLLFPHSWSPKQCKGRPHRVLRHPNYGVCSCWDRMNKFNVVGYGRFRYMVNQPHCTHEQHGIELSYDVLQIELLPISIQGPTPKATWQKMYLSNSPKNIQLRIGFNWKHVYRYQNRSMDRLMRWQLVEVLVKPASLDVLYRLARKLYAMAQRRASFGDLLPENYKRHTMRTRWLSADEKALIVGDVGLSIRRSPLEY